MPSSQQIRTRRPGRRLGGALVAFGLLLAACGDGTDSVETAGGEELSVATADGGQLDWGSLDGRDVILWFWAPW